MKYYLSVFIMFMILVCYVESTTYNAKKFKTFLKHLKPGIKESSLQKHLNKINQEESDDDEEENEVFLEKTTKKNKKALSSSELEIKYSSSLPTLFEGWVTINSNYLKINNDYPSLQVVDGKLKFNLDENNNLINTVFQKTKETEKLGLDNNYHYFRMNKNYITFSPSKESPIVIFFIRMNFVTEVKNLNDDKNCIQVLTKATADIDPKFIFCNTSREAAIRFDCILARVQKGEDFGICEKKIAEGEKKNIKVIKRQIKQPYFIIPTPQRMCNQKWTYQNKGGDWECLCREGKEQSPIDLPEFKNAVQSPTKPKFSYDPLNESVSKKMKIKNDGRSLHIPSNTDDIINTRGFGKVVTMDGTVYFATDIVFHTPSEHTINGKRYPMEIQIHHDARSKGDFGKKVVLSFLFKGQPGIYNKFVDDIEFYNLPNPHDKFRYLHNRLFVPDILINTGETSSSNLKAFNFYTYQGSMTTPPCTENVIHYVAADPIPASITALDMFKEALRNPDYQDEDGNILMSAENYLENYRNTQPLNGRTVFGYDSNVFSPPIETKNTDDEKYDQEKTGHYEKQENQITNYFYVEGNSISNVPGAIVVPAHESV